MRLIKEEGRGWIGLHGLVAASTKEVLNHPCPVVTCDSDSLEAGAAYHFCIPNHSVHAKPKEYFLDLWVIVGSGEFLFPASLLFCGGVGWGGERRKVSLTHRGVWMKPERCWVAMALEGLDYLCTVGLSA